MNYSILLVVLFNKQYELLDNSACLSDDDVEGMHTQQLEMRYSVEMSLIHYRIPLPLYRPFRKIVNLF